MINSETGQTEKTSQVPKTCEGRSQSLANTKPKDAIIHSSLLPIVINIYN